MAAPAVAEHSFHRGGDGAAIVYAHPDFRGQSLRVTGPITHLNRYRFNDKASSIRVTGGSWEVCVDPNRRRLRIGQRLYDARQSLCETKDIKGIVFGGRLPVSAAASKARFSSTAFFTSASRCSMSFAVRSKAAASRTLQAAICSSASASPSTFALSSSAAGGGPRSCDAASLAASVALMARSSRWTAAFSARSALATALAYSFCAFCDSATAASTVAVIFRISSFRALAASEFTDAPPKKSNKDGLSATTLRSVSVVSRAGLIELAVPFDYDGGVSLDGVAGPLAIEKSPVEPFGVATVKIPPFTNRGGFFALSLAASGAGDVSKPFGQVRVVPAPELGSANPSLQPKDGGGVLWIVGSNLLAVHGGESELVVVVASSSSDSVSSAVAAHVVSSAIAA